MSQNVNNILAAIARLTPQEKMQLMHKLSGYSDRAHPINEGFGRKHGGAETINFAPRTGGKCPACGK